LQLGTLGFYPSHYIRHDMIKIFTTGGTFDKIYFDANSEFSIGDSQVEPILEEANVRTKYTVESLLSKDSLEITAEDRQLICEHITTSTETQLLITHGSDTMVDTAIALAAEVESVANKVIVLLGAMQPARMRITDAPFNLGFALAAVQLLPAGIYIAMNGKIFHPDDVRKNRSAGRFETLS
jgi:L-asparaginase